MRWSRSSPNLPEPEGLEPTEHAASDGPAERIGILGGTFDPPHHGHVAAARAALDNLRLDRLLLVVANDPWQKSGQRSISNPEDRLALTEALAEEVPGTEVSRLEIDRGGTSYTVDTVEAVRADAAGRGRRAEIFLVVGADLVGELETWHRAAELKDLVTLAVVSRPGSLRPNVPTGWRVHWLDGPQVMVSSSEVRDRLVAGDPVNDMVPERVMRCIRRHGLYAVR
jgi:nicotinate-nucleotide adenylyltransferase